jgi:putative addiction module antidote
MQTIKLRKFGNSIGAIISKEILTKMKAKDGDSLYLIETEDGYKLTQYNPKFMQQMNVAEDIMKSYRNALKALAK